MQKSLKTFTKAINRIDQKWGPAEKQTVIQKTMTKGLHSQLEAIGDVFTKLVQSVKNNRGLSSNQSNKAQKPARKNMDHLDELDQRSLMGKIRMMSISRR